ncbi:hypothetical protein DPMN_141470 [Dreissena polymorpha]|uniref:Uncharacterized protein n=1 Tax=Dreissena polymorpha TaxID=45954 RepID=A0A9D4JMM2_DREPO|nr:hypothetical protein DPMN_141470 [Dreissena polymorpha]
MAVFSVGVVANLTVWVYNLSYSGILRDRNSRAFLDLANPFCDDVSTYIHIHSELLIIGLFV